MASVGRIFLPQEPPENFDIGKAEKFGVLQPPMMPRDYQAVATARPAIQRLAFFLQSFNDADFILPVGDPTLIGLAQVLAFHYNDGRYNLLKWDRRQEAYYLVHVNVKGDLPR